MKNSNTRPGPDMIHGKLVVDVITHISPFLEVLFNKMIVQAHIPKNLNTAIVVPIFKGNSKMDMNNYRPISIISFILKIYEKLIYNRLFSFIKKHRLISDAQFGFMPGSSTEDALINTISFLQRSVCKKKNTMAIFIDLQKAFDSVNHEILLGKLNKLGIRGAANDLIKASLENREIYVDVNGIGSSKRIQDCGVPQGSILGPLLFILSINDIIKVSNNNKNCKINLYADDMVILFSLNNKIQMQNEIDDVCVKLSDWLNCNLLDVNHKKTNYIIFEIRKSTDHFYRINIQKNEIQKVHSYKYLGIIVDDRLKFDLHIDMVTNKVKSIAGVIYRINVIDSIILRKKVYFALVHSLLSYGVVIWGSTYDCHLTRIKSVQKKVVKIVCKQYKNEHIDDLMLKEKIMNLSEILKLKTGVCGYRIFKGNEKFNLKIKKVLIDSSESNIGVQDCFYISKPCTEFEKRSLSYRIAYYYNEIHKKVKESRNLFRFKSNLKRFIVYKGNPINFV